MKDNAGRELIEERLTVIKCREGERCGIGGSIVTSVGGGSSGGSGGVIGGGYYGCTAEIVGGSCYDKPGKDDPSESTSADKPAPKPPIRVSVSIPDTAIISTYDVKGSTHEEIFNGLTKTLYSEINKKYVSALTTPTYTCTDKIVEVNPKFYYAESLDCVVSIETKLPKWIGKDVSTSKCLVENWNKMIAALSLHEREHVSLTSRFREQLQSRLSGQTVVGSTSVAIKGKIEVAINDAFASMIAGQLAFDAATNYGAKTGVNFPDCVAP